MRCFKEIRLASSCYLWEAARWLAFGRIPEAWGDHQHGELRNEFKYIMEDFPLTSEPLELSEIEVKELSVDADFDEYFQTVLDPKFIGPKRVEAMANNTLLSAEGKLRETILSGALKATAILSNITSEEIYFDEFVEIPREKLDYLYLDFRAAEAHHGELLFQAVRLETNDILRLFPELKIANKTLSISMRGEHLLVDDKPQGAPHLTRRGRKPILTIGERRWIEEYFTVQISNRNPSAKERDADAESVREFVKKKIEKDIGRSTAQNILKPIYERMNGQ